MSALQYTGKQNAHNIEAAIVPREIQQQLFPFSSIEVHSYPNYSAFTLEAKVLYGTQLHPGINYIKLERVQINL